MSALMWVNALWLSTLVSTVAVLAVALLRPWLRRWAGAPLAYQSWLLVPVACAAALLPLPKAQTVEWLPSAALIVPPTAAAFSQASVQPLWSLMVVAAWLIGLVWMLWRMGRQQQQLSRALGTLTQDLGQRDVWRSPHQAQGPLLLGCWHPRIVIPADFEQRYTSAQQSLVIEHEQVHWDRRDPLANMVAAVLHALFWFNPLMARAHTWFRQDQEMACDAEVLRRQPGHRAAYAEAILATQLATQAAPLACHWQRHHPLKERIMQLQNTRPRPVLRRFAHAVLAVTALSTAWWAWAQDAGLPSGVRGSTVKTLNKRESTAKVGDGAYTVRMAFTAEAEGKATHRTVVEFDDLAPGEARTLGGQHENLAGCEVTLTVTPVKDDIVQLDFPLTCPQTSAKHPRLRIQKGGQPATIELGEERLYKLRFEVKVS